MISHKKPHIFKNRYGKWRVIPARCPMTFWEKWFDEPLLHLIWYSFHQNFDRYVAQKNRKRWNELAVMQTNEWNLGI